jgi:hypothetical protein
MGLNHEGLSLRDMWILDSGASGHLITRNNVFISSTYKEIIGYRSTGIRSSIVTPIGIRHIRLCYELLTRTRWLEIPNVQFTLDAGVNLLSLGDIWPYINAIEKLPAGFAFTQNKHRFTSTLRGNLMILDTIPSTKFVGTAYSIKDED